MPDPNWLAALIKALYEIPDYFFDNLWLEFVDFRNRSMAYPKTFSKNTSEWSTRFNIRDEPDITLSTNNYYNLGVALRGQYRFLNNFPLAGFIDYTRYSATTSSSTDSGCRINYDVDVLGLLNYGFLTKYNVTELVLLKAGASFRPAYNLKASESSGFTSITRKTAYTLVVPSQ